MDDGSGGNDENNGIGSNNILAGAVKVAAHKRFVDPNAPFASVEESAFRQEGTLDYAERKLMLVRSSISLNETACVVCLPELIEFSGMSKLIEGVQKGGFNIIGLRLMRFTKAGGREFLAARTEGGKGNSTLLSINEMMELLEYDLERVSLIIAVESDNAFDLSTLSESISLHFF